MMSEIIFVLFHDKLWNRYSQRCCAKGAVWNVLVPHIASIIEAISILLVIEIHISWNFRHTVHVLSRRVTKQWHVLNLSLYETFKYPVTNFQSISQVQSKMGVIIWCLKNLTNQNKGMLLVSHRCIQISTCNRSHSQKHKDSHFHCVAFAALSRSLHWLCVII